MKRLNILEFILSAIAAGGIGGAVEFGSMVITRRDYQAGISMDMETSYDGGAIAMGIIGAASLFSIVFIELAKFKKNNTIN